MPTDAREQTDPGADGDSPLTPRGAMGEMIRRQREAAQMSLRELSRVSQVSNAYLSQIERGMHEPSVRVVRKVAEALSMPLDQFLGGSSAGSAERPAASGGVDAVEAVIRAEPRLEAAQQDALLAVYRSYLQQNQA